MSHAAVVVLEGVAIGSFIGCCIVFGQYMAAARRRRKQQ
jgi:hypothetical protein